MATAHVFVFPAVNKWLHPEAKVKPFKAKDIEPVPVKVRARHCSTPVHESFVINPISNIR